MSCFIFLLLSGVAIYILSLHLCRETVWRSLKGLWWGTLSNAFLKSKYTVSIWYTSSYALTDCHARLSRNVKSYMEPQKPSKVIGFTQEVQGSTPTSTCSDDFFDPIDQDIHTQCALSWKIVVSEWLSVITVSLSVREGVHLTKPAKLYMCMQTHFKQKEDGHMVLVCPPMVLYPWATRGMSLQELDHRHIHNVS